MNLIELIEHVLRSVHTVQFFHPIILQPTFKDNNWMCERQFLTSFRHFFVLDENRTCSKEPPIFNFPTLDSAK